MQNTDSRTLVSGLPARDLAERLQSLRRCTDLGHRALAFYLADMDERRAHLELGSPTTIHFATSRLGMSRWQARALLDAGLVPLRKVERELVDCDTARLTRGEHFAILWRDGLRCRHCHELAHAGRRAGASAASVP